MCLEQLRDVFARFVPDGSPRRKLLQLLAIILVVEGLSVLALFSYAWVGLGIVSILIGAVLLILLPSGAGREEVPSRETPGIRLIDTAMTVSGGEVGFVVIGASVIALVFLFNIVISERPDIGDLDTISILFGGLLAAYPLLLRRFKTEAVFSLIFLGFVVVFLVFPQVILSVSGGSGASSIGNWYVQYMLASPFAGILNLIGIPTSAAGNTVMIEFKDGTVQLLSISAYCAGLYSFSIFLSAFFSFVLVFENLGRRTLAIILPLGLLVAYVGNLLRMVIIGVVGYYHGLEALLWTHENVGWIVFLSWSAVFWWMIIRYVDQRKEIGIRGDNSESESQGDK